MRPSRLWALVGLAPWLPPILATSLHFPSLSERDASCSGLSNLTTCGSSHPSSWCCPVGTQCLPLNNTGTDAVICCPDGNSCSSIQTITCDISFQDPSKYPDSSVHIANLSVALPVCGTQCCPLGYSCQSGSNGQTSFCRILDSTTSPPASSSAPGAASSSKFPFPSATASPQPSSSSKQPDTKYIIAAVIPVLVALALLVGCLGYWTRRRVKVTRQISEPIYDPQRAARSDFLNRYAGQRHSGLQPRDTLASNLRPATADSATPLTDQPVDMQVRTVYPPRQRPWSGRLSMPGRASSTLASTPPSHSDSYSSRLLPAVPVSPPVFKTASIQPRDSIDKLPASRYRPGKT